MMQRQTWKSLSIARETRDAITIVFDTLGQAFSYQPGQYINLSLKVKGKTYTRSYSLSSSPSVDKHPALTIKSIPQGIVSNFVFDEARDIAEWQVEGPFGFFYPSPADYLKEHHVFIGGGSGITPLYSQIRELLHNSASHITLVYVNRTFGDIIFREQLDTLSLQFAGRLKVWHFLSRETETAHPGVENYILGKPGKLHLKKLLRNQLGTSISEANYFMCGPSSLLEMAEQVLQDLGIPASQVYKEYFTPPENDRSALVQPGQMQEVLIHYADQTNLLEVMPGKTILEAGLEDHMKLPYSCQAGTCGQCVAKLLKGKVHMRNNYAIPAHKLEEGYILLCQSHPLDNEVTVEAYPLGV